MQRDAVLPELNRHTGQGAQISPLPPVEIAAPKIRLEPSKYDESNVPKPSSPRVTIETVEEGMFIAIRFSGNWSESHFEKYDKILNDYIIEKGYKKLSDKYMLRYNPPITPALFRKNEIMYRIEKE